MRGRRRLFMGAAMALFLLALAVFALVQPRGGATDDAVQPVSAHSQAQTPDTETKSCHGVFSGADNPALTKTFVSEQDNGDGTFTLTYRLTSTRADDTDRVRDCAFVDTNGNGRHDQGEPVFGTDDKNAPFTGGQATISITVAANPGDTVCDRAARSDSDGDDESGGDFTDKSNVVCHVLGAPPPVIPEVPLPVLLPLGAAGLFAAAFVLQRRRQSPAATVSH